MIEKVVRARCVKPYCLAVLRMARKDAASPFVVTGAEFRVPWTWIGRSVIEQIQVRVVRKPSPYRAAANLPLIGRPARDAEILPVIALVKGLKSCADQNLRIGACAVGAP